MLVGYCRCSTRFSGPHRAAQRADRARRQAESDLRRPRFDRHQPGSARAARRLAACRSGDTLVVTKLDRLARSLTDARNIVEELTEAGVKLNIGGSVHDPTDPVGRLLYNVLGMIAEFESDLIRMRTREGMKVAKAKGRLRGKQPNSSPPRKRTLSNSGTRGRTTSAELAELFSVARSTVYRAVQRAGEPKPVRARRA
jgi:DNA invertase Pin-like site-specific DNA recombinase